MAALFFLAFAYFAVGQAAVVRNSAQTAADAAALAAAREYRDEVHDAFLQALMSGDLARLGKLLTGLGQDDGRACRAAQAYAADNRADLVDGGCTPVSGPPGYTVAVISRGAVGSSVIKGTESKHATATATAVVEPRCATQDEGGGHGQGHGHDVAFTCTGGDLVVDPTVPGFTLNLADFFSVHLSK